MVDFDQYDSNIVLPAEVPPDEWASISVTLSVQIRDEPTPHAKRPRNRVPHRAGRSVAAPGPTATA